MDPKNTSAFSALHTYPEPMVLNGQNCCGLQITMHVPVYESRWRRLLQGTEIPRLVHVPTGQDNSSTS